MATKPTYAERARAAAKRCHAAADRIKTRDDNRRTLRAMGLPIRRN